MQWESPDNIRESARSGPAGVHNTHTSSRTFLQIGISDIIGNSIIKHQYHRSTQCCPLQYHVRTTLLSGIPVRERRHKDQIQYPLVSHQQMIGQVRRNEQYHIGQKRHTDAQQNHYNEKCRILPPFLQIILRITKILPLPLK